MQEKVLVLPIALRSTIYERICKMANKYGLSEEEVIVKALELGFSQGIPDQFLSESLPPHLASDASEKPSE